MTAETKNIEVRGKTYTIKRFDFEEGAVVDEHTEAAKGNRVEQQAFTVFYGTVEPKFESVEAVKKEDREMILHLWLEINKFNQYEASFLSLLKNLPSQASPRSET
jgi:hypothetical protein